MNAPSSIRIDPEFESLIPPLAPDELAQLEQSLQQHGCRDPLLVWKERQLVLDGHNRFRLCRRHNIAFTIAEVSLPDREACRAFIVKNQMTRRNLSPEALSYLRGRRYAALKRQGKRPEAASGQADQKTTAARLAAEYHVGEKTIRRDAIFAVAVDVIAGNCGADCRKWILSRDAGLTRGGVHRVARMTPEEQRKYLEHLRLTGKRPRGTAEREPTLRLSTRPAAMATELIEFLGPGKTASLIRGLKRALNRADRHEAAKPQTVEGAVGV